MDAMDENEAIQRFAAWCIQSPGWWWWRFEASLLATTYLGARQLGKAKVEEWSEPIFHAFLAGAWVLHWTEDTLYWFAKPTVHVEEAATGKRLHNATGPALDSDIENLHFWHGVMVPEFVIMRPEFITVEHIQKEENVEVRRVMLDRYGIARYLVDSKAERIHEDEFGELYRTEIHDDEPLVMVKVLNSTQEPDGSRKSYFLRVHPELCPLQTDGDLGAPQKLTAMNAIASTFGLTGAQYARSLAQES